MVDASQATGWSLDIRIVAALIGLFAFIVAQVANAFFVFVRDRKQSLIEKRDIARFARAELVNVKRHHEANIIKLNSILASPNFGERIDFDKMKLSENGLVALDLSKVYVLQQELTQDLLRFSLFCRNNELEIRTVFETILGSHSDAQKNEAISRLKERFASTVIKADEIAHELAEYEKSPEKYASKGITWSDSLFKLK